MKKFSYILTGEIVNDKTSNSYIIEGTKWSDTIGLPVGNGTILRIVHEENKKDKVQICKVESEEDIIGMVSIKVEDTLTDYTLKNCGIII